jgi:hypothetical protein
MRAALVFMLVLGACSAPPDAVTPATHERFPIDVGSLHEGVDCNACHGEFDSFKQFTCHSSGCHADADTTPRHAIVEGYEYVSQSCYLCHPRGITGAALDHTTSFPIAKTDVHKNTSCSVCHTTPGLPRDVTCASGECHTEAMTDSTHPDSLGYVWGPKTCLPCHPSGDVGGVDHTTLFPIRPGETHGTVACVTCHEEPKDYKQLTCMTGGCHKKDETDVWHEQVSGYEYVTGSCLGCHPNGQTNLVDHTRFFPIEKGDVHGEQACGSCHKSVDRAQVSCASGDCHARAKTDQTHGAVLGYEYLSSSCLACHPQAKTGQQDHSRFFPIAGGTPHAEVACESCHRDPVSRTPVTCVGAGCHVSSTTDAIHSGFTDYAFASGTCLNCHVGGQKQLDHSAYFPTQAGTPHAGLPCAQCHSNPGDRHVLNCANAPCHDPMTTAIDHQLVGGFQWQSSMCVLCHGDGSVPRIAEHLPFGITNGYPHFNKPCLQCHSFTKIGRPALADFTIRNCFSSGCHIRAAVNTLHAVVAPNKYVSNPAACTMSGCHENGRKP